MAHDPTTQTRKLATILALDVAAVGDQAIAAEAIERARTTVADVVAPHGGRVFNSAGAGLMLEFPAASSGVEGALALLKETRAGVRQLPQIRIGLHLGEVMVGEGGDLLGHGVNVAARLMALAEPGTAVVSDAVRHEVRSAAETPFVPEGRIQLDKMSERIAVFSLNPGERRRFGRIMRKRMQRLGLAAVVLLALGIAAVGSWMLWSPKPPPGEAVVAVLPFEFPGNDPEAKTFADSFTSELHYTLSTHGKDMVLIGRSSSSQFPPDKRNAADIRDKLHATHWLTGTVTRTAGRFEANVELVDAKTGLAIWRQHRDASLADLPTVLAAITDSARERLQLARNAGPGAKPLNPEAVELYMTAMYNAGPAFRDKQRDSIASLTRAVELEPTFVRAWQRLALAYATYSNYAESPALRLEAVKQAQAAADRAIELAPNDVDALMTGVVVADGDKQESYAERAGRIDPDHPRFARDKAQQLVLAGKGKEALAVTDRALTTNPLDMPLAAYSSVAAAIDDRPDRIDQATSVLDLNGRTRLWPTEVIAWSARGDYAKAEAGLARFIADCEEMDRKPDKPSLLAYCRRASGQLQPIVRALKGGDAAARSTAADAIAVRVLDPTSTVIDDHAGFYESELPALALLAGPDRAFEVWNQRLDKLPPFDPMANDHSDASEAHIAEAQAMFGNVFKAAWRPLHRDPRFWKAVARYNPYAFIGGPRLSWINSPELWPPDLCALPNLPYNCQETVRAIFTEADKALPRR